MSAAVLSVRDLQVAYGGLRAVDGVSFDVERGQTLALVGESGCGKSSAARAVMQLLRPSAGSVQLEGEDLAALSAPTLRQRRRRFQMIFQDPISSLNPQRTVREILEAPLRVNGLYRRGESEGRIRAMLERVQLDPEGVLQRKPHEFSGGQCQRISIARALMLDPVLLVCDEPVSALDVSVRAQVLNVLNDLRAELGLATLFISHDLAVVRNVADGVAVMYLGRIVESGPADAVFNAPQHPYTAALLSAVPLPDPDADVRRWVLQGELPSALNVPSGCRFRTRCPRAQARCAAVEPALTPTAGTAVACHFPLNPIEDPSPAAACDGRTLKEIVT